MGEQCTTPFSALIQNLLETPKPPPPREQYNPRPKGVMQAGRTSELVLAYLVECGAFRTEAQIRWATKRTHAQVSAALLFLRRINLVKTITDPRNNRYRRYIAVKGARHDDRTKE